MSIGSANGNKIKALELQSYQGTKPCEQMNHTITV